MAHGPTATSCLCSARQRPPDRWLMAICVRSRSSGYVTVVAVAPAAAPDKKRARHFEPIEGSKSSRYLFQMWFSREILESLGF